MKAQQKTTKTLPFVISVFQATAQPVVGLRSTYQYVGILICEEWKFKSATI